MRPGYSETVSFTDPKEIFAVGMACGLQGETDLIQGFWGRVFSLEPELTLSEVDATVALTAICNLAGLNSDPIAANNVARRSFNELGRTARLDTLRYSNRAHTMIGEYLEHPLFDIQCSPGASMLVREVDRLAFRRPIARWWTPKLALLT